MLSVANKRLPKTRKLATDKPATNESTNDEPATLGSINDSAVIKPNTMDFRHIKKYQVYEILLS